MTAQQFLPNRWVDIESVMELKRQSIAANTLLEGWWRECEMWAKFRGGEYGCKYAEAFVHISTVASIQPENIAPRSWFGGGVQINHDLVKLLLERGADENIRDKRWVLRHRSMATQPS